MAVDYTTTGMVATLKKWCAIPSGQPAFSTTNLIQMLSDELLYVVVPFIMSLQEEFFVRNTDTSITASTTSFAIPSRAMGNKLRDVKLVDSNGEEADVPRINPENDQDFSYGITVRDSTVRLLEPGDWVNYSLRQYYYLRPSYLVAEDESAKITSVSGKAITVSTVPSGWSTSSTLDVINGKSPFNVRLIDQGVSDITSNVITMDNTPTGAAVGDYLALAENSPVANIPYEAHPMLIQSAILKILESLGDKNGLQLAASKYAQMQSNLMKLLSPRITGATKVVNNQDSFI